MKTFSISLLIVSFMGLPAVLSGDARAEDKNKKKGVNVVVPQFATPPPQQPPKVPQLPPGLIPQQRQAPVQTPPGNTGVRVQPMSVPVQLLVANTTGVQVDLVWLDPNGRQQSYGRILPLEPGNPPHVIETYAGHVWLFKVSGRIIQSYTATATRQQRLSLGGGGGGRQVVITQPPVVIDGPRPAPIRDVPAPAAIPGAGDIVPAGAAEFLQVHNDARKKVGVPALKWSDALAKYAQTWANQLAASGSFQHRDQTKTGYGENLFGGSEGYAAGDAARHWLKEKAAYNGEPVTAANFNSVGHYTQMVWADSTEVGFGMAVGPNGVIVVANYSPGGNRNGKKPF